MQEPIQRCANDCAFVLRNDYPDRLTIDQSIRMEIARMVSPERLGQEQCGDAIALFCQKVRART